MKRDLSQWLKSPPISFRWGALLVLVWLGLLLTWQGSQLGQDVEARLEAPFLFHVRQALGRTPPIDPRIKVFAFDDKTLQTLGRARLNSEEWALILERFDTRSPRAVVIDSLFSVTDGAQQERGLQNEAFVSRLSQLKTTVIVGAYAAPRAILGREPLPLDDHRFQLSHYLDISGELPSALVDAWPLGDRRGQIAYGPAATIRAAFRRQGHLHYGHPEGRYYPFLRLSDHRVLPHLALQAFEDVRLVHGRLLVAGAEVPVYSDGSAPINYPAYKDMAERVVPIRALLNERRFQTHLDRIQAGDIVYVMPLHFTGHTDFKPSPIGLLAAGFNHFAVLNSLLSQDHLRAMDVGPILIVLFACIAALLAWYLQPTSLAVALLGLFGFWTGSCIVGFVSFGLIFPWLTPSLSLLGVGFSLLIHRAREVDRRSEYIQQALEGALQPQALSVLQEHPERLDLEARDRVVTVMFVDIVGFSIMVENQLPRLAFKSLQQLMANISAVVHEHGGVVNKTLGDGLLCFFGYSFEEDRERPDHAHKAIQAAIKIQNQNIPRILAAARNREPVFPLRIGINTATVFMGNLGSGRRLDLTVIGNGVNFAKRLEGACLPHSVLVGPTTKELVEPYGQLHRARRRMVSIKHHSDMVEAWEYDPLEDRPELRDQADEAFRSMAHVTRLERRWTVARPGNIVVTTLSGSAHLLNFSSTGMSFALPTSLPRGKHLEIQVDSADGQLRQQLSSAGMQRLLVEVRWVQRLEDHFIHGVRYLELDARQTEIITDYLCQYGLEGSSPSHSRDVS